MQTDTHTHTQSLSIKMHLYHLDLVRTATNIQKQINQTGINKALSNNAHIKTRGILFVTVINKI